MQFTSGKSNLARPTKESQGKSNPQFSSLITLIIIILVSVKTATSVRGVEATVLPIILS